MPSNSGLLSRTSPERRNPVQQLIPADDVGTIYNTEAPATVVQPNKNGSSTINLVFATGDFQTANYNTRLMYVDAALDPLRAENWYLAKQTFLQSSSANQAFGPGSGGFFRGPDGQPWFAYGAYDRPEAQGGPNGGYPRTIRVQQSPANDNGVVLPTTPIDTPRHNTPGH